MEQFIKGDLIMIEKVNNLTLKSFKNYSTPDNLKFKRVNIFFGYNGRGKSSLAKGVEREIQNVNGITEENYRIFAKDYLKLKLINDKNRLKGVKAVFGNKNVKNDEEIESLKSKLTDTSSLEKEINSNLQTVDSLVKTIENDIRGSKKIRHVSIQSEEELSQFKIIFEDYKKTALKITTPDKLLKITADFDFDKEKKNLDSLPSITISNIEESFKLATEIINKPYKIEDIPATNVLDWIESGLVLNQDSKKCLFCGSEIKDFDGIKNKFNEYINSTRQKDERNLKNFLSTLELEITKLENFIQKKELFDECKIDISSQIDALGNYQKELIGSKTIIENKLANFESTISTNFDKCNQLREIAVGAREVINTFVTESKTKIEKEESKLNDLLKGLIATKVLENKQICDLTKETNEKLSKLHLAEKSNELIKDQIKNLKNKVNPTFDFANFINGVLLDLDVKFKLDIIEEDYRIVPLKSDDEININDISEGEKNLLSLLFFYFELFEDSEQKEFKDKIEYVVVDDPLSSLDDNNRAYLISILQMLFKQENLQVFVFTHDWDAYCQLLYNVDKHSFGSFEIKKDKDGVSKVEIGKPTITPYEHDFFEILNMSKITADELDDSDIYHLPNCLRRVLETFLKFKVSNNSPTNSNISNVSIGLFNKETLDAKEQVKLMSLLTVINAKSHEAARNAEDVHKALKFLVNRIEAVDETHFKMLKNKKSQYDQQNGGQ